MFIVYSKPNCTYCTQSKALLKSKGLDYLEIMLDLGQPHIPDKEYVFLRDLEKLLPGVKTVPQIFERVNEEARYIGGFAELKTHLSLQP